ncbi:wiskott-Aldrich syndrome protein homolog [Eurytemora carolleeae]|uniref:wiskott-Aldrich syndrome protein homolog n=1 Tax=Eurytemora carolleeae TaxID=1294199 RepID=UPI000C75B75F|nr:wiskott-Aldrich syndrome protein homolog [Eurytemora carolleeae]|eukprot:XP_023343652.1 wiskott-Aldrich syndrome protein homolog [Eurytemora affinis]
MLVLVNACTGSDHAMIELTWLCCKGSFRFTFLFFRRRRGVGLGPQSPDSPDCGVGGRVGVGGGCATEATRGGGGGATGGGGKDEPLTPPHTPSEEERLRPNPGPPEPGLGMEYLRYSGSSLQQGGSTGSTYLQESVPGYQDLYSWRIPRHTPEDSQFTTPSSPHSSPLPRVAPSPEYPLRGEYPGVGREYPNPRSMESYYEYSSYYPSYYLSSQRNPQEWGQ